MATLSLCLGRRIVFSCFLSFFSSGWAFLFAQWGSRQDSNQGSLEPQPSARGSGGELRCATPAGAFPVLTLGYRPIITRWSSRARWGSWQPGTVHGWSISSSCSSLPPSGLAHHFLCQVSLPVCLPPFIPTAKAASNSELLVVHGGLPRHVGVRLEHIRNIDFRTQPPAQAPVVRHTRNNVPFFPPNGFGVRLGFWRNAVPQ